MRKRKKAFWAIAVVAVLLVGVRAALPRYVERHVNRSLEKLDDYRGGVGDVDLALWRGAYTIEGIVVEKVGAAGYEPFFEADTVDISLEWKALFSGAIVAELSFVRPVIRLIKDEEEPQLGEDAGWVEALRSLTPWTLNRVEVADGSVTYRGDGGLPLPELAIDHVNLVAWNISNAEDDSEALPSDFRAVGVAFGGADLVWEGRFNLMRDPTDMDMTLSCENIDMTELNALLRRVASLDVSEGRLDVYSEWSVASGHIDGYVKLLMEQLDIFDLERDAENPLSLIWQSIAGLFVEVVENQPRDQFATKIPFEGDLNQVESGTFEAIVSVLENGFVAAMRHDADQTINFSKTAEKAAEE